MYLRQLQLQLHLWNTTITSRVSTTAEKPQSWVTFVVKTHWLPWVTGWVAYGWWCGNTSRRSSKWQAVWSTAAAKSILALALLDIGVVLSIELTSCRYLFLPGRDFQRHCTGKGAGPMLKWYTGVAQVRILERYHFETWASTAIQSMSETDIIKDIIIYQTIQIFKEQFATDNWSWWTIQ